MTAPFTNPSAHSSAASLAETGPAPPPPPVNLADLTAKQLARLLLAPPAHLLVDCGGHLLPHPLGVCRFVAQLLQMRSRGTDLWLRNVHPSLRRYLRQMDLEAVFHVTEEAYPTGAAR